MVRPLELAEYTGFTEAAVHARHARPWQMTREKPANPGAIYDRGTQ